ncbi:MAG: TetR family transcriptional regulator [Microbacterium sp.]
MSSTSRRKRDPEARRLAIVSAAAELIVEVGVDAITHRMVASRAAVPLGATTQYFDTLDDLRAAALRLLAAHIDEQMVATAAAIESGGATPATLAALIHSSLVDAKSAETDRAVVTAAVRDPQLRELARNWSAQLVALLERRYDAESALAASVFIDGILWHSQIHDVPLPRRTIERALASILGDSTPPHI